jgi:tRNA uridine 5-carbamoylmethylation protein Kti12
MKKLILVCGPAGIGKSTFCKDYVKEHPNENVHIIASDEIRRSLTGSYHSFLPGKNMMPIYQAMAEKGTRLFHEMPDLTVMLDTTMLYDNRRLFFVNNMPRFDEEDLYLLKLKDYNLCFQRNKLRAEEKWVPDDVIADMIKNYVDPTPEVAKKFDHVLTFYLDEQKE